MGKLELARTKAQKRKYFEALVKAWQDVLGVGHYGVGFTWKPKITADDGVMEHWAQVSVMDNLYWANMEVADELLREPVEEQSEVAAHEVLHIVMSSADNFMSRMVGNIEEDDRAKGVVSMFKTEWAIINERRVDRLATCLNTSLVDVILDRVR